MQLSVNIHHIIKQYDDNASEGFVWHCRIAVIVVYGVFNDSPC